MPVEQLGRWQSGKTDIFQFERTGVDQNRGETGQAFAGEKE
jgi:hypothetical protein